MPYKTIAWLRRNVGWRLNLLFIAFAVALTDLVVASVEMIVLGSLRDSTLLVATVSGLIVATVVVGVAGSVRGRIARLHRRELEASFAGAKAHFGVAVETAQMLFWEIDLRTGALGFEHDKLTWLGLSPETAVATVTDWVALVHPQDSPAFLQHFQAALQSGAPAFDLDYRLQRAPGEWVWVHTRGSVKERTAQGEAIVAVGGTISIMQRKLAEDKLRKSETLLRATLAATDEGILMIGQDGLVLTASQRFLELWRVPSTLAETGRDDLLLAHVLEQLCEPEAFMRLVTHLYDSDADARDTLHFKDGRVFSRFTRAIDIEGQRSRIWCFKDITEQTRFQTALAGSEQKLRSILDGVDACIYLKDVQGRYLFANRATCELWNRPLEEVVGCGDEHFFDEQTARRTRENDRAVFESGEKLRIEDINHIKGSEEDTVFLSIKLPLRGEDGSIYALCGISTDITERKRAERALKESETKLRAIFEMANVGISIVDRGGHYCMLNSRWAQSLGFEIDEMRNLTYEQVTHPDDLASARESFEALVGGQTESYRIEKRYVKKDRSVMWADLSVAAIKGNDQQVEYVLGMLVDITQRKLSEQALVESEQRTQALYTLLRMVADNVPDMIWAKSVDRRFLFANRAVCEQLLMANDTDEPLGKDDLYFAMRQREAHPDDPDWHTFGELCQDSDAITLNLGRPAKFEEFGNVNGKLLYLDVHKAPLIGDSGEVIGVVGSARDITTERETMEQLRVSSLVLANSSEALMLSDADNHIVDVNPAFTRITGYTLDEVQGRDPRLLHSGEQNAEFYQAMWAQIESTGQWQGEVWNLRKNGELFAEWLTVNTLWHPDGRVHRRVGLFSDITEKKRSEELIWKQANFDQLTGLPNRRMFLDRLAQDIKRADRAGNRLALMFLDLDNFKEINDTLGHEAGDELLTEAARRIASCTRGSDTVARHGGDEFTVILPELTDDSGIDRIATSILSALTQPFVMGVDHVHVSASIGITLYPDDAQSQDDLLRNADQAMYVSKDAGRNRFSYFTRGMQANAQHRLHLLSDLRSALSSHQLELHYQPIVELHSGRIHKAEALLRWVHPVRGSVGPAEFIRLAEDSGLIHEIGDWVFAQAVGQAQRWRATLDATFQVSVNLSPMQIQSGAERFHWYQHLQATHLVGDAVVLEITEGLLLNTSPKVVAELLAYRDAGIQVAIDDFGTGYSAMSYLKQLDIDYLKIDQVFVNALTTDASDRAMCEAMVVMAHALGLKVIAEGVETVEQREVLKAMGCDYAQGFLFAKALPAPEFEVLIRSALTVSR
jgi:diguanylate cyclase (GGDEF)-like protein/PAS domain S-box-containing protein